MTTSSIVRSWSLVVSLSVFATAGAGEIPRYALKPGQILDYEERQSLHSSRDDSETITQSRVWVVDRDDAGSARVVVRQTLTSKRKAAGNASDYESTSFARFNVLPDGTVPFSPSLGARVDPADLFPRLPNDDKEAVEGWQSRDDRDDATIQYKPAADQPKDEPKQFAFEADQSSYMERIYEGKDHRVFHFDRDKGLVTRAEIVRAFGAHMNGEGKGSLELKSVTEMEPAALATFRADMDRYFDADLAYKEAVTTATKAGHEAEALLKKSRTILADVRAGVKTPEAIAALDKALESHDQYSKYQIDDAKRFAEILGKPAAGWGSIESSNPLASKNNTASEVKDLDGRPHSIEQYRGKVLVLDFWYRGCGWCMRAMPQVKKLAAHYRDKPVAVFGMNNDQDEKDARFVVQTMRIEYPVIRSMDLPARYGVHGFPTLVIIDQEGKVADVHIGYSPRLYEEVSATIDRLLKPAK